MGGWVGGWVGYLAIGFLVLCGGECVGLLVGLDGFFFPVGGWVGKREDPGFFFPVGEGRWVGGKEERRMRKREE